MRLFSLGDQYTHNMISIDAYKYEKEKTFGSTHCSLDEYVIKSLSGSRMHFTKTTKTNGSLARNKVKTKRVQKKCLLCIGDYRPILHCNSILV